LAAAATVSSGDRLGRRPLASAGRGVRMSEAKTTKAINDELAGYAVKIAAG